MTSVITGNIVTSVIKADIINSRQEQDQNKWIKPLKAICERWGDEPLSWEIYRGDEFQLEINKPEEALLEAIKLKAAIKGTGSFDVRMALGLGKKTYSAAKITESNGEVFINSGETFSQLEKSKKTMAVKTPWQAFNETINIMLEAALLQMDKWTKVSARIVQVSLENPDKKQSDIAKMLEKKSQSDISEGRARAGFDEIMAIEAFYRKEILNHLG